LPSGKTAKDFLGTQGDIWDAQRDMMLDLIRSILDYWLLSKLHNRLLKKQHQWKWLLIILKTLLAEFLVWKLYKKSLLKDMLHFFNVFRVDPATKQATVEIQNENGKVHFNHTFQLED
jgi:hypothetical protein